MRRDGEQSRQTSILLEPELRMSCVLTCSRQVYDSPKPLTLVPALDATQTDDTRAVYVSGIWVLVLRHLYEEEDTVFAEPGVLDAGEDDTRGFYSR